MKLQVLGQNIHYQVHNNDQKKTVVFIHGNSHDQQSFSLQSTSPLLKNYRMISLDLPGHGASDTLDKYTAIALAEMTHEFFNLLELKDSVLVGHSLGGHVILHLLSFFGPQGIFIYGAPPLKKPLDMSGFKDLPEAQALFKEEVTNQEKADLISCLYQDPKCDPYLSTSFHQTDPTFRSQILESLTSGEYLDEVELLNNYKGSKAILAAEKDQLINPLYLEENINTQELWKQEITQLPGSHNLHRDIPKQFNKALLSFLNQVSFS